MATRGYEDVVLRLPWILAGLLSAVLALALPAAQAAPIPIGSPSCAEGPQRVGDSIEGTPCADTIVVPAGVASVSGGGGNDTIVPGPISAAVSSCPSGCRLGVGSQTFEGGPGDDIVFGERGNDTLLGGGGNDKLFGGPGDDLVRGGPGDDLLVGGFGADTVDGEEGNDYIRGDATIDHLRDSGQVPGEVDTLSYSTGISPGFTKSIGNLGFPKNDEEGRGVYLDLTKLEENGDNGVAPNGGGVDDVEGIDFERIVGSPFSDYIKGSKAGQTIYGGGGADVLEGGGAETTLNGGADGDDCVGGATTSGCEKTKGNEPVATRNPAEVSVGSMTEGAAGYTELYLLGSSGNDNLTVDPTGGAAGQAVTMHLGGGSTFQAPPIASDCTLQNSNTTAVCTLTGPLDSLLVAGMSGADKIQAEGLPGPSTLIALGGEGNDEIFTGNESDDTLVDGPGNDTLHAGGGDDAVVGNSGQNVLFGDAGNDLFLSNSVCEGATIEGGDGRDNASWAKFKEGVGANLESKQVGHPGAAGTPSCPSGTLGSLHGVEDLEGSGSPDTLYGDGGPNQLLGHEGADTYRSAAGEDLILANAADADAAIDCGADTDIAIVDFARFGDPSPVECERVIEAAKDNFSLPPLEPPLPPESPPKPRLDTKAPRTRLGAHPPRLLRTAFGHRRVVFRFSSSEAGSHFSCRIDGRPFRVCTSPRAYAVGPGRHTFRVVAADQAGNVDRTPAVFHFRVETRPRSH
ncbi:MAG TPA: calcium-binding protein [Solirubrobacterales bacterium]|nr:calcium-binding protein [Solirubrobacterales bacterium]